MSEGRRRKSVAGVTSRKTGTEATARKASNLSKSNVPDCSFGRGDGASPDPSEVEVHMAKPGVAEATRMMRGERREGESIVKAFEAIAMRLQNQWTSLI